jgi:hypothetical protein
LSAYIGLLSPNQAWMKFFDASHLNVNSTYEWDATEMELFCSSCEKSKSDGLKGDHKHNCKDCNKRIKVRCTFCGEIFSQSNKYHEKNCTKNLKRQKVDMEKHCVARIPPALRFSSLRVTPEINPSVFYSRFQVGGVPCIISKGASLSTLEWSVDYLKEKLPDSKAFVKICNKEPNSLEDAGKLLLVAFALPFSFCKSNPLQRGFTE